MSLSEAVRFINSQIGRSLTDCDALQANDEVQRKLWYGLLSSRNYENQISFGLQKGRDIKGIQTPF